MKRTALLVVALFLFSPAWSAERSASPAGAKVFIIAPKNHAVVSNPIQVRFGIEGMTLAPAGTKADNSGHHHLLIDTPLPKDLSQPLPVIENKVMHFGKGQTETTLTLPPGKHTLQLVLGDYLHVPHNPPVVSKKITITVK
jgi:hypothetical protein